VINADTKLGYVYNRATARVISRRFQNMTGRVPSQRNSCGTCASENGTLSGFLQVLQFPLPIPLPLTSPVSLIILKFHTKEIYFGFEILATVAMTSTVLWIMTPCSFETARRFRGIYPLSLQGRRVSQTRNQQKQAPCLDPEDGGDMLLRNGGFSPRYTALKATRPCST
jgi:hypothetical protein